ncbi:conserved hypothetical protein [Leishmania major strain Friedlin]|uniref:Uncharacterized protein n=1 Tax=Leishmania major TaxID=5664 RepID=Q4QB24_LEIMA|nr:conserved hypothetical protein [Leishmania major strain Friedlin]CAG9574374.1 hypothetical_protein_-_conserved [Leishmania major strain Friedlin]CAJ04857.1 conserved hypothetical protein [Leishmania major strain Friedlin]|eukprot:XP_001683474.1 conserved hypothetical protein [Leishmania major strain Friedlin]
MPLVVQQQHQHRAQGSSKEQGHTANAAAPTPVSAPERGTLASAETPTTGDAPGRRSGTADYSRLLTLAQPQLTASEATLFALFRGAQKERQLVRQQRLKEWQKRFVMEGGGRRSSATPILAPPLVTDPFLHLRGLEEPCLLIPDTRGTSVSLGLAADLHSTTDAPTYPTSARATPDAAIMDGFHLGLTCISTDYRTDYASLPLYYVLGVPTALLSLLRPSPSAGKHEFHESKIRDGVIDSGACTWRNRCQAPVDLSRWLVFDIATSQVLLRRRGVPRTDEPPVPRCVSALETQVFLAHTYNFDPRSAYEAAVLQARVPAQPSAPTAGCRASASAVGLSTMRMTSPPLYTLFFFTVARGQTTTNSGVSPIDAGLLYPTCFSSYMSEVPTTQQLAAETAAAAQRLCLHHADTSKPPMLQSSVTGSGAADNSSFFVSMSGKRLRAYAGASSSTSANLWTAQLQSRKLGAMGDPAAEPSPSPFAKQAAQMTITYRAETESSAPRDQDGRGLCRQITARQEMAESFRMWREAVATRVPSPPLRTSTSAAAVAGNSGCSRTPPPMTNGQQRLPAPSPHPEHPPQRSKPTDSAPLSPASREQGREENHRSRLEEQLDTEGAALMSDGGAFTQEWSTGFRFGRVAIEVAVPLLFPMPAVMADAAAAPSPLPPVPRGAQASGTDAVIDAPVRVIDAPLADALWRALYTPAAATSASPPTPSTPFSSPPSFFSTTPDAAAAEAVMTAILPTAEERLMLARERVLLPFLLHQPRWVLPGGDSLRALPSSSSRVSDTDDGPRAARERNRPPPVNVCPSLWRLHELEQLCGWRRYRLPFNDVFGSFSRLLIHDLYIMIGRRTRAMLPGSTSAATARAEQADRPQAPLSPLVLLNDAAYVERVLLPAMRCFSANTCTWADSGLCVYRSPYEVLRTERRYVIEGGFAASKKPSTPSSSCVAPPQWRSQASCDGEPADSPAETASEVALHHRQLSLWLQQLQRVPHELLRRWLAECHGRTSLDPALDARVRMRTGGVPAACLVFFVGSCSSAASTLSSRPSRAPYGGDDDDLRDSGAVAASAEAVEKGLQRLLSLTPDRIAVVPLLDFVVWGALCSDFSAASVQHLTHAADRCRAALDAPADGLAAVKYCVRYPQHLCCNGGRGTTVALLR